MNEKIAVLMGGRSLEREVSLRSGERVFSALQELGYRALALDVTAYRALSARARQFAEFAFSPQSVAEAIRGVYTSLLARDA